MKIRNGFVSNSSSSSFIVINRGVYYPERIPGDLFHKITEYRRPCKKIILPCKKGKYEFGWEEERTYGVISKLNYVAIQALCIRSPEDQDDAKRIIEEAIGRETGDDYSVKWDYNAVEWDSPDHFAAIDHQSCCSETGIKNLRCNGVFESVDRMHAFLFNPDSYIQGGNDNGGSESEEYIESLGRAYGKVYAAHLEAEDQEDTEYHKVYPLKDGHCKYNPESELLFCTDWEDKEGNSFDTWREKYAYFGVDPEEHDFFIDGYYFCSKPCDKENCPFKKWYIIKHGEDILEDKVLEEYMDWQENLKNNW